MLGATALDPLAYVACGGGGHRTGGCLDARFTSGEGGLHGCPANGVRPSPERGSGGVQSQMLGVTALDPLAYAASGAAAVTIALVAAWMPASRAARWTPWLPCGWSEAQPGQPGTTVRRRFYPTKARSRSKDYESGRKEW